MPRPLKHSWRRICTCGPGEALLHWPRPEGRSPGISGNAECCRGGRGGGGGGAGCACCSAGRVAPAQDPPPPPPLSKESPEPRVLAKMFILSLMCVSLQVLNLRQ